MKNKLLILLTLLVITIQSKGFNPVPQDSIPYFKNSRNILNPGLGKEVFSSKNLIIFGSLLGGAFLMDEWANDRIRHNQFAFGDKYTNFFNEFGEKKIIAPSIVATWAIGTIIKDERLSNTALNSAKALVTGAILTEGIKIIAGRSRPDQMYGSMHFDAFGGNDNNNKSFPSGHSFVAWSVFTPFAEEYSKWIYVIPASVSLSRMYRNRHWFSDVVLGGGIGYFAGLYFHKRKNQRVLFSGNGIVIKF
ncbi:phosphatase PAP2 family protein [Marinifilum fragile]|uniref:phosphatase PAP2 family protein n=1 Tax=Marinifilum fragile TaxID=570161 RepID=UPI002AAAFFEC|nr:phosphatase PAP2 family protein [Marinifilum fragile]